MNFHGFTKEDFDTFHIVGLDERMNAIKERIQPKFKEIGDAIIDDIAALAGNEMYVHIAKHARRTKNPPNDTWLAIASNKRGYKKHPHFQIGLFDDHVFLWLAYIYELPNKKAIAETLLDHIGEIKKEIPKDFVISVDHTKKEAFSINEEDMLTNALERFRDIKKGEFLIGKQISSDDPLLTDEGKFIDLAKDTFKTLMPIYQLSYKSLV